MKTTTSPIGQLKAKSKVYCSICGCVHNRVVKTNIYENTPELIEKAKIDLTEKAKKEYTCRICKSIAKGLN